MCVCVCVCVCLGYFHLSQVAYSLQGDSAQNRLVILGGRQLDLGWREGMFPKKVPPLACRSWLSASDRTS